MKRKASFSLKSQHIWKRKAFALLLLVFSCFTTIVIFEAQHNRIKLIGALYRNEYPPDVQSPKIAFMFIARNRLPLDMVWDAFFQVLLIFLLL